MTQLYDFQPSTTAPFQFRPTLDGALYLATITWNLYGQRYYMLLTDQSGAVVFLKSLRASQVGIAVASAVWDFNARDVVVTTAEPHGYAVGLTVDLTFSGMAPDAFNGVFECYVTSATTVVYSAPINPGVATLLGTVSYDIDMAAGSFSSTIVWRAENNVFEITP